MSKKVHHLCKTFFPIKGGIEVVVDAICRATNEEPKRFSNTVVSCSEKLEHRPDYPFAIVKLVRSYGSVFSLPIAPKMVLEVGRSLKTADVVVVHYPFPIVDFAISVFGFLRKSKVIVYWHSNIVSQRVTGWLLSPFTWLMLNRADRILVATPPMIENSKLLSRFRDKVEVLPYSLRSTVKGITVSEGEYFIAIGRHVAYKGFDCLIEAMALNDYKLKIIGDGPLFDSHQRKIDVLNLNDRVELLRNVSNSEKEKLLAAALSLVLPSIYPSEAFALVQLEAMRYGKPIINTSLASGVPWVARDGKEAITVKPGCANSLSVAMDKVAADESLRQAMSKRARKRYLQRFNGDVFDQEILKLVEFI